MGDGGADLDPGPTNIVRFAKMQMAKYDSKNHSDESELIAT